MLFSNLKTFFGKRTFINVLFWKIQNTFEKNDSLHSLRRTPSQSYAAYLYAADIGVWIHYDETNMLSYFRYLTNILIVFNSFNIKSSLFILLIFLTLLILSCHLFPLKNGHLFILSKSS